MDLQHEPPTSASEISDSPSLLHEAPEETVAVEPERALSRAQARDRRWREIRSRRLQRCIDVFGRIEWLGYAITEPLILWTFPVLFVLTCAGYFYSGRGAIDSLSWGSCLTLLILTGISLLGWAIRGLGHGLRKLSVCWGEDQAIEVRDPGNPSGASL